AICYTARDKRIKALGVRSPVYDTQYVVSLASFDTLAKIWMRNNQMNFPDKDLRQLFKIQSQQFNPASLIKQVKVPICIIAGGNDEILEKEGFKQLNEKVPHDLPSEFYLLHDADHNFTKEEHFNEFKDKVISFFRKYL
ncbi:MAG: alpha/beta hydrolase, partial [Candidatus Heimdallarchaeaceae archaeon]